MNHSSSEHNTNPTVYVDRRDPQLERSGKHFVESFRHLRFIEDFQRAEAIFIKPNLTYPTYKPGVTTRPEFIEYLVAALRGINSTTKIIIGEGEGGYNTFSMTEAMHTMGFYKLEKQFPNVNIVNLTDLSSKECELTAHGRPYRIALPTIFFDNIDFSISCPLPKVHGMTKVTLSFKNQWGCLPDTMRLNNHFVFNEIISQISDTLKFRYAFLDGRYGLDTNGPMDGDPVEVNWFVASNSLGAFDMTVADLMGFDWRNIGYLKSAGKYGLLPDPESIRVVGDIDQLRRKFTLKRGFWHYPALAAFHSSRLTHLFYFSKAAKPLHDMMYLFRKRPISE